MVVLCGGRSINFKMRISIREQLGLLVLLCSLTALMVLALATVSIPFTAFQRATYLPDPVVPKLPLHHQYSVIRAIPDCISQSRTTLFFTTSLSISGAIGIDQSFDPECPRALQ